MTKLKWSEPTARRINTGLDRGVFYPNTPPRRGDAILATNLAKHPRTISYTVTGNGAGYQWGTSPLNQSIASPSSHFGSADGPPEDDIRIGFVRQTIFDYTPASGTADSPVQWLFTETDPKDTANPNKGLFQGTPGHKYRVTFWWRHHSPDSTDATVALGYASWDNTGTVIGGYSTLPSLATTEGGWVRYSEVFTMPVGAIGTALAAVVNETTTGASQAGATFDVSALIITDVTVDDTVDIGYFDGSTPTSSGYTYAWQGAQDDSESLKYEVISGGIPWDGLVSVDESGGENSTAYYLDGRPYLNAIKAKEFSASIKAYTYPDEMNDVLGLAAAGDGLYIDSQMGDSFGLSYRTQIYGILGDVIGHRIHLVYNATVSPIASTSETLGSSINASDFTFDISAVPVQIDNYRASAHLIIDTTDIDPIKLAKLEAWLYGTPTSSSYLPQPNDVVDLLNYGSHITITDNGDGTWTAEGSRDYIHVVGDGTFRIDNANAVDNGDGTYTISSS